MSGRPDAATVTAGILAVTVGCLAGCWAAWLARRSGNWLWLIVSAGTVAVVAGIVGQRVFPSDDLVRASNNSVEVASRAPVGPWDAGITLPGLGVHITPVAAVGLLVCVAGISLVLFLEPVTGDGERRRRPVIRGLDEDDAV